MNDRRFVSPSVITPVNYFTILFVKRKEFLQKKHKKTGHPTVRCPEFK